MSKGMFVHVMDCDYTFEREFITNLVDFNGPVYSQSLKQREAGAGAGVSALPGVGVDISLTLSEGHNTCAMLNVEEGVAQDTSCHDVDKKALGEIFLRDARKWIPEAVKQHRIASDMSIEDLILVTGFYKTANWEAAALSSSSSTGNLSFTIKISQAGGGASINWDSVQHLSPDYSTGHRHPGIPSGTNNPAGPRVSFEKCCHRTECADRTQCIFLRGFRIRERLLRKDRVAELLGSPVPKLSGTEQFMRSMKSNSKTSKPPSGEWSQRSPSPDDHLEPIEEFPDANFCDQLYNAIAVEKFKENNSDFVLVHDDELIGKLERDAAALDSEPGSLDGRQAVGQTLYNRVIGELEEPHVNREMIDSLMGDIPTVSQDIQHFNLNPSIEIRHLVSDLGRSKEEGHQETAQQSVEQFTDPSIFILRGHTEKVWSVAFSPDGTHIVSGSGDLTIRIWDVKTGEVVAVFRGHTEITSVAFSPDGTRMVSGSDHVSIIFIWDAMTGEVVEKFRGHTDGITSVAFSPDGRRVVSGSMDGTVRIWDAKTGKQVLVLEGHTDGIASVAFSPDGRCVVSGSMDRTVRIWDARTGKLVRKPFQGPTDEITSVAFESDGRRVVSRVRSFDHRIWDAEMAEW